MTLGTQIMEDIYFKDFKTSRGITYHYYRIQAQENRPTLFFCHGFPSTSYDWRHQIAFFKPLGYGIVAPDMLGYGGTDRPTETDKYRYPLQTKDFDELLEHEKLSKVVLIGHDWGCMLATQLMIRIPHRFIGLVLLAAGFVDPQLKLDPKTMNQAMQEQLGFTIYGYQEFFEEDGAGDIIVEHYDAFESVLYPEDPATWKIFMNPVGAVKEGLLNDRKVAPASYVSKEEKEHLKSLLLKDKLRGALQWYKVAGTAYDDALDIPKSQFEVQQPTLFVGALQDYVCVAEFMKMGTAKYAKNLKTIDLDTSHWIQLEKPDELNKELHAWFTEQGF